MFRIAWVLALGLAVGACGDQEKLNDIGQKAAATWKAVAGYTVEQKDKALAFFGDRMTTLEGKWSKAKEKSGDWSEDAKAALESKWTKVQEAFAATKEATGAAWGKTRDAFVAAFDAFQAELDKHK